jgi:hypothetical protein
MADSCEHGDKPNGFHKRHRISRSLSDEKPLALHEKPWFHRIRVMREI